jgi:hypothetical protein
MGYENQGEKRKEIIIDREIFNGLDQKSNL